MNRTLEVACGRGPVCPWPLAEEVTQHRGPEWMPESVFPPHLCCCRCCGQLPISSYQQEASDQTKDFISFWLDLAGACITRKSSEGSGIIWTWGVGTCAGHGAGKSWTPLPGGAVLSSAGTGAPDQGALTMAQPDSLCPFERRRGIG